MSLQQWHKNGWLRPYETSRKQIEFCNELRADVLDWLRKNHSNLAPKV